MERYSKIIAQALSPIVNHPVSSSDLEIPPDRDLGDFAFPCFTYAKALRKAPPLIAKEFSQKLEESPELKGLIDVIPTGPYINFKLKSEIAFSQLLKSILSGDYGTVKANSRGTWVLEYSSPNIAKPFQIYHLRPTALGAALARIGKHRGWNVVRINHLGDWGTQYGKLSIAFKKYGASLPKEPSILDLVNIYVQFHKDVEAHPELEDEARAAFVKLENNDPEMITLWKKCVDISLKEFNRIYKRLNIEFDHFWGESFYKDQLASLLSDLKKKNILIESEGAWIVPVKDSSGKELPPCILQKKDGATIYATRDVAAAIYRHKQFNFDRMTYIVGAEQKLHFEQVFGVLRKMNASWADQCEHVPFGLYRFKDSKMSTRKGNFVTFNDVMDLAKDRVYALMKSRDSTSNLPTSELDEITEAIAVGAIVFHDLSNDPAKDLEFDVEKVVDFQGETGPYLQYAHTRCLSILKKSGISEIKFNPEIIKKLSHPDELKLIKSLGYFSYFLERALQLSKANQLTHFLIDITKDFGAFYRNCHVISEDQELTEARLMLVEATRLVLAKGLSLLGVPLPERM